MPKTGHSERGAVRKQESKQVSQLSPFDLGVNFIVSISDTPYL
jgi:hypothetical protein